MIQLDFENCFEEKIGKAHGLSKKKWADAIEKYQPVKKILQRQKEFGFLSLPFQSAKNIQSLEKEAAAIRKKFRDVIFIGIGGSSLGAIALFKSLKPFYNQSPHFYFLDNPESDYVQFLLKNTDPKKTLLVPISKSGETIESLALFSIFYKRILKLKKGRAENHVITITEENKGPLYRLHAKEGFKNYTVPKNVGGRFSVLSNVGLFPAALMGINIPDLLAGAQKINPEMAYRLSLLQYFFYQEKKKYITVFFPYGRKMEGIADWYVQLLAESIGKNEKIGPTPLKAVGAIDQHAQMQLFMEGPNNKFLIFLETRNEKKVIIPEIFKQENPFQYLTGHELHTLLLAERKASSEALAAKKRPNITLTLSSLNEENVGQLLFLLELQVAFLGELFKVNAFNQPGVELGKKLTLQYLTSYKNHG